MSRYALAGEPVPSFIKRGEGAVGAWVVRSKVDGYKLQRNIGASAYRKGFSVTSHTMPSVDEKEGMVPSVKYTLVMTLTKAKP